MGQPTPDADAIEAADKKYVMRPWTNPAGEPVIIARGERIAQLVVQRVAQARLVEVATIAPTQRGAGGFGSTGVKGKAKRGKGVKS